MLAGTLAEWWDAAPLDERRAAAAIVCLDPPGCDPDAPFDDRTRDALLEILFGSSSDLLILPIHDVFGWRDRINYMRKVMWWQLPRFDDEKADAVVAYLAHLFGNDPSAPRSPAQRR